MRTVLTIHTAAALLGNSSVQRVASGEIHVWGFDIEAPVATAQFCAGLLSPEERDKAARFVFERDRLHYRVSHGVMRVLLASYLGEKPAALALTAGAKGKPALAGSVRGSLSFNLTHSGGRALLAIGDGREVGVDLERHRPIEAVSIAGGYFFGSERDAILRASDSENLFFRYWTAKEAVMKGCGAGLSLPLDQFAVQFIDNEMDATVYSRDEQSLEPDWHVSVLNVGSGWSAALAARGSEWQILPRSIE